MKVELIAKVCHEANKAFCEAIGDRSQRSWDEAEEWQKQSAIKMVEFALSRQSSPVDQHEAWLKERIDAGWKWGEVKDVGKKIHPSILPFDQLPSSEKTKDYLFLAVVNALREA